MLLFRSADTFDMDIVALGVKNQSCGLAPRLWHHGTIYFGTCNLQGTCGCLESDLWRSAAIPWLYFEIDLGIDCCHAFFVGLVSHLIFVQRRGSTSGHPRLFKPGFRMQAIAKHIFHRTWWSRIFLFRIVVALQKCLQNDCFFKVALAVAP